MNEFKSKISKSNADPSFIQHTLDSTTTAIIIITFIIKYMEIY